MVISSSEGTDPLAIVHVAPIGWRLDREAAGAGPEGAVGPVDGVGDRLWFVSGDGAPLKKIVRVDLSGPEPGSHRGARKRQQPGIGRISWATACREPISTT
jgi:prolyl oligopeptidase